MSALELSQLTTAVHDWCQERPVRLCVLFGSQATGKTHPNSDVDLAVWPVEPLAARTKLRWVVELQNLLDNEVSLALVSPELDSVLGWEIVRDGVVIFAADAEVWPRERSRLWHLYNDSLPFRRALREQLRQFAQEVPDD